MQYRISYIATNKPQLRESPSNEIEPFYRLNSCLVLLVAIVYNHSKNQLDHAYRLELSQLYILSKIR